MKRDVAARFSFLLSIPAVLASGLFELVDSLNYLTADMALNLVVATIVSGISGYIAIDFLLKFLKKHTTFLFVYYRIVAGIFILILLLIFSCNTHQKKEIKEKEIERVIFLKKYP